MYCLKELGLDKEKVNVNGGAIAFGHPLDKSCFSHTSYECWLIRCRLVYAAQVPDRSLRGFTSSSGEVARCGRVHVQGTLGAGADVLARRFS